MIAEYNAVLTVQCIDKPFADVLTNEQKHELKLAQTQTALIALAIQFAQEYALDLLEGNPDLYIYGSRNVAIVNDYLSVALRADLLRALEGVGKKRGFLHEAMQTISNRLTRDNKK